MSDFKPIWQVTIAGVDYTDYILANLTISSGRSNIYEQAYAGYCNIEMINLTQAAIAFGINDSITISVKDSTNTFVPIFGGSIVEFDIAVATASTVALTQSVRVLALGALSRLPKALTNGVLTQELDGVQIETILSQVLFNTWAEVPAAITWANYDPTITWANAENNGLGEIDTGNYELAARSSERTDVYSLVAALATSGLGYLYEDAQGRIGYADSTHRTNYRNANGYVEVSGNKALAGGVRIQTRAGDVRNDITLKYGAGSASETSATDAASIAAYGQLAQIITTTIKHQADAEDQAAFYLTLRAQPQANFDAITYELTNSEITNAERDALIGVFMGMPISIPDLPLNMVAGQFLGFVEGWTWQAAFNQLSLTITASPLAYSLQAMRWNDVPITEIWSSVSPTLDWQSATIVG
jgi:hypothetical protein